MEQNEGGAVGDARLIGDGQERQQGRDKEQDPRRRGGSAAVSWEAGVPMHLVAFPGLLTRKRESAESGDQVVHQRVLGGIMQHP